MVSAIAFVPTVTYANDVVAEGLCGAVAADDRQRFRTVLSNNNIRLRNVYDGIVCDNQNMLQFAITSEAVSVGEMIVRQLPIRTIEDNLADGRNILEWAEASGFSDSAVLQLVKERINL